MVDNRIILLIAMLMMGIAFSQIEPSTINISGKEGEYKIFNFNVSLDNQTCYASINSQLPIYVPSILTGNSSVVGIVYLQNSGNFTSTISYCNYVLTLNINVEQLQVNQTTISCPAYLKVYGQINPGKTIKFDIRDSNYNRVKNSETIIEITDSEGNIYSVECPEGSCNWQIPENAQGTFIAEVTVPNCNPLTQEINIKPLGEIQISVPNTVKYGEGFYVYVFDPAKGPLKYANIKIFYPDGRVISGKTNENGIVMDESLTKTFGKEMYPENIGFFKIQAFYPGYNSKETNFQIVKGKCPYECCINENLYEDKACASGYKCENHACVIIRKPKIEIACNPLPSFGERSTCYLYSNNTQLSISTPAKLIINDKETTIQFTNGATEISFDEPGNYKILVSYEGYEDGEYSTYIEAKGIPIAYVVIAVVILALLVAYLMRRKKEEVPKTTRKIKISAPSAPMEEI